MRRSTPWEWILLAVALGAVVAVQTARTSWPWWVIALVLVVYVVGGLVWRAWRGRRWP